MLTFLILILGSTMLAWGLGQRLSIESQHKDRERRASLLARFKDKHVVDMIMNRMFWVGQTSEQLEESLGRPAEIDRKILQTKVVETWKYGQTSRRRFNVKIILADGTVTKFDQKAI